MFFLGSSWSFKGSKQNSLMRIYDDAHWILERDIFDASGILDLISYKSSIGSKFSKVTETANIKDMKNNFC